MPVGVQDDMELRSHETNIRSASNLVNHPNENHHPHAKVTETVVAFLIASECEGGGGHGD